MSTRDRWTRPRSHSPSSKDVPATTLSEPCLRPAQIHERRVPDNAKNRLIEARPSEAVRRQRPASTGCAIRAPDGPPKPQTHIGVPDHDQRIPLTARSLQNRSQAQARLPNSIHGSRQRDSKGPTDAAVRPANLVGPAQRCAFMGSGAGAPGWLSRMPAPPHTSLATSRG